MTKMSENPVDDDNSIITQWTPDEEEAAEDYVEVKFVGENEVDNVLLEWFLR